MRSCMLMSGLLGAKNTLKPQSAQCGKTNKRASTATNRTLLRALKWLDAVKAPTRCRSPVLAAIALCDCCAIGPDLAGQRSALKDRQEKPSALEQAARLAPLPEQVSRGLRQRLQAREGEFGSQTQLDRAQGGRPFGVASRAAGEQALSQSFASGLLCVFGFFGLDEAQRLLESHALPAMKASAPLRPARRRPQRVGYAKRHRGHPRAIRMRLSLQRKMEQIAEKALSLLRFSIGAADIAGAGSRRQPTARSLADQRKLKEPRPRLERA